MVVHPIFCAKKSKFVDLIQLYQIPIQIAWVWVLCFALAGNGRERVGVPGGCSSAAKVPEVETYLGTFLRAAAAQSSPPETD
jgi:hypothetical protein